MKKTLIASAIAGIILSNPVYSQNFNLTIENMYNEVYESLSGVIIVSDKECNVPDYTPIVLHYYGNSANTNTVSSNNSSSTIFFLNGLSNKPSLKTDNFTYIVEEPVVVSPKTCDAGGQESVFGGAGECIPDPYFKPYIEYQEVTKTCLVYGTARLSDSGTTPIVNSSRSVYDITSNRLYLSNTEIWTALEDTGEVYSFVGMKLEDGVFVVTDAEK